jgi:hypothetical protein
LDYSCHPECLAGAFVSHKLLHISFQGSYFNRSFTKALDPENTVHVTNLLADIDQEEVGFVEWFLQEHLQHLRRATDAVIAFSQDDQLQTIRECDVSDTLHVLKELLCLGIVWASALLNNPVLLDSLAQSLESLTAQRFVSSDLFDVAQVLVWESTRRLHTDCLLAMIRCAQAHHHERSNLERMLYHISSAIKTVDAQELGASVQRELRALVLSNADALDAHSDIVPELADSIFAIIQQVALEDLDYLKSSPKFIALSQQLVARLPPGSAQMLQDLLDSRPAESMQEDQDIDVTTLRPLRSRVSLSLDDIQRIISMPPHVPRTPIMSGMELAPDLLAMVTVSPSALLRSPATSTTGLTKTYTNNAFREQTQRTPSNTSRMPSMHVDDYEHVESPVIPVANLFAPSPHYATDAT